MALIKKLTKIGNSFGVILSAEVMKMAGIDEDSDLEISVKEHQIVIKPTSLRDHKATKTFLGVLKDYDETFKKLAK